MTSEKKNYFNLTLPKIVYPRKFNMNPHYIFMLKYYSVLEQSYKMSSNCFSALSFNRFFFPP